MSTRAADASLSGPVEPPADGSPPNPNALEVLARAGELSLVPFVAALRWEMRQRWRRGERVLAEEYLRRFPVLAGNEEAVLDLIYQEVPLREEMGEAPDLEEFLHRFPAYESQLRRQFALHRAVEDEALASPLPPEDQLTVNEGYQLPEESPHSGEVMAPLTSAGGRCARDWPALPGYEVLGELGRGGMGVVYQARQTNLGRVVALKMILGGADAAPQELARFRAEARAVARLQHPHIVQLFEVGEHQGRPFFSMEYVDGGSLAARLKGTPLPPRPGAQLVESLARAVHHAHQRGVVHRDLKPGNVPLTADGTPKVTDFGLAKRLDGEAGQSQSGVPVGTPSYMAPEQAEGRTGAIGARTDVYALGAIRNPSGRFKKPSYRKNPSHLCICCSRQPAWRGRLCQPGTSQCPPGRRPPGSCPLARFRRPGRGGSLQPRR